MTSLSLRFLLAGISLPLLIMSANAQTGTVVWANNASLGNPHIQAFDLDTGAALADFPAPSPDAHKAKANGRGIAVMGTKIYYSLANSGSVYLTDTVTHADGGVAFNTGLPGIGGLSWDGAALWVLPYVNLDPNSPSSQNVYSYSLNGTLLSTVRLTPPIFPTPAVPRDGLAVTPTGFLIDRGASVPYDMFDLSGNAVSLYLIVSPLRSAGVAFDGLHFIVSDVLIQQISIYDLTGLFLSTTALSGAPIPFGLEGLSFVAPPVQPPPPVSDTVRISKVGYSSNQLRIEATSTNPQAILTVSVTSSGQLLGTLSNAGGGKYTGQFIVSTKPQNITVNSSGGGVATAPVI
jgi:hypothetical protein